MIAEHDRWSSNCGRSGMAATNAKHSFGRIDLRLTLGFAQSPHLPGVAAAAKEQIATIGFEARYSDACDPATCSGLATVSVIVTDRPSVARMDRIKRAIGRSISFRMMEAEPPRCRRTRLPSRLG